MIDMLIGLVLTILNQGLMPYSCYFFCKTQTYPEIEGLSLFLRHWHINKELHLVVNNRSLKRDINKYQKLYFSCCTEILGWHPRLGLLASQCREGPRFLPSAILSMWFPSSWSSDGCRLSSHRVHTASGKVEGPRAKCACQLVGSHPTASAYVSLARFHSTVIWQGRWKYENTEPSSLLPQIKLEIHQ